MQTFLDSTKSEDGEAPGTIPGLLLNRVVTSNPESGQFTGKLLLKASVIASTALPRNRIQLSREITMHPILAGAPRPKRV